MILQLATSPIPRTPMDWIGTPAPIAADTLQLVARAHDVVVHIPTDLAWLLGVLLAAGVWIVLHTALGLATAVLAKAGVRSW